ncbi:MAG: type II toxin-antitoxin system HipA family toxin [Verrucomicrobia bacterium]|nr:type II toxin-antitoxin system HipA family toxin [Verrucomicrobiota bacterium]
MEDKIFVYIDLEGAAVKVGELWSHYRNGRESFSFEYDRNWLKAPNRFSLDPALRLLEGSFHASQDKPLFGAIDDSAPDRWGRLLMRRAERKRAENEKRHARALREIDFLLTVDDEARLGALRFKREEQGPFLTTYEKNHIPPLISVSKLLAASNHVLQESDSEEDLRLLLAPGSSLGGARPKATIRDKDGQLAIAKFPKKDDEIDTIGWEAVALHLAHTSKIQVPQWRLEKAGKSRILISRRFDREHNIRVPFLSAMSMLMAKDGELHCYLEIADAIRQVSVSPQSDLEALWRRIVFNVLISNVDDHLRNHAFLYSGARGWSLSPAYDLNPTPTDIRPRVLSTAIDFVDSSASLSLAIENAHYFDLEASQIKKIIHEVGSSVSHWRQIAAQYKIAKAEIDRMASAFEHEDLLFAKNI